MPDTTRLLRVFELLTAEQQAVVVQLAETLHKLQWSVQATRDAYGIDRWTTSELQTELARRCELEVE